MKAPALLSTLRHTVAAGLILLGCAAQAAPINLVKNGGFELSSAGTGQIDYNTVVNDWSSPQGYNFLFAAGSADTTGAWSWYNGPNDMALQLWGANNGGANPLASSSNGGNFLAADGYYGVVPIQQTIHGLTVGQTYQLSFEWAAAQQYLFHGETDSNWTVTIGDSSFSTTAYHNAEHGSSNWMHEAFTFTATMGDALLSFLAAGTPAGHPPFSLLDGVSLVAVERPDGPQSVVDVPEPASLLIMGAGIGLLALVLRRRRA